jgi:hypothetical protein
MQNHYEFLLHLSWENDTSAIHHFLRNGVKEVSPHLSVDIDAGIVREGKGRDPKWRPSGQS